MNAMRTSARTATKLVLRVLIGGFVTALAVAVAIAVGTDQQTGDAAAKWMGEALAYIVMIAWPVAFLARLAVINLTKEDQCNDSDDS